jgi:hypothetical protein
MVLKRAGHALGMSGADDDGSRGLGTGMMSQVPRVTTV